MYIYYYSSTVTGIKKIDEKHTETYRDEFIHLSHQDPILMACRRSNEMAGADTYRVSTRHAFRRWMDVEPKVHRRDIPVLIVPEYEY